MMAAWDQRLLRYYPTASGVSRSRAPIPVEYCTKRLFSVEDGETAEAALNQANCSLRAASSVHSALKSLYLGSYL